MTRAGLVRESAVAAVAVVVALLALWLVPGPGSAEEQRDEQYAVTSDRVADAVAGARDDHVHVTPDGRPMLSEADERALADAITGRDLPVHVIVWAPSRDAGYDHPIHAAEQLAWALTEESGGPVAVVLWQGPEDGYVETTPGTTWAIDYDAQSPEFLGEAGLRLTEWVDGLPDAGPDEVFRDLEGSGAGEGVVQGVLAGLGVTLGVALVAVPTRLVVVRRRRPRT